MAPGATQAIEVDAAFGQMSMRTLYSTSVASISA